MTERSYVGFYREECQMMERLTDAEIAALFKAKSRYVFTGELPDFPDDSRLSLVWIMSQQKADFDGERFTTRCENNAKAATKRWKRDKAMRKELAARLNIDAVFLDADDDNADADNEEPP